MGRGARLPRLQSFSNVDGTLLDDAFEPGWETTIDLGVLLWIHFPAPRLARLPGGATWVYKMLGWPVDTSVAIARLLFGGVLDRHENLRIVTHHLGGTLPHLVGRFRSWYQIRQDEPDLYAE